MANDTDKVVTWLEEKGLKNEYKSLTNAKEIAKKIYDQNPSNQLGKFLDGTKKWAGYYESARMQEKIDALNKTYVDETLQKISQITDKTDLENFKNKIDTRYRDHTKIFSELDKLKRWIGQQESSVQTASTRQQLDERQAEMVGIKEFEGIPLPAGIKREINAKYNEAKIIIRPPEIMPARPAKITPLTTTEYVTQAERATFPYEVARIVKKYKTVMPTETEQALRKIQDTKAYERLTKVYGEETIPKLTERVLKAASLSEEAITKIKTGQKI